MDPRLFHIDTALITPRTVIRRFREQDGETLHELIQRNDSRLNDYLPALMQELRTKEQAEVFVREKLAAWLQQKEFTFGLWDNDSARLIGLISIFRIDWRIPLADITFFIDQEHSGKGIMTEAINTALGFAFRQLKLEKLRLPTAMDNYAAQRLARKCGFRREGDLRAEIRLQGDELVDVMLFGLTRSEYLGV